MLDLLRHPREVLHRRFRHLRFRDRADDLAALTSGEAVLVAAFLSRPPDVVRGSLLVRSTPDAALIWVAKRGGPSPLPLTAPVRLVNVGPRVGSERFRVKSAFSMIEVEDATTSWRFAVPTDDVPLLRRALSS